MTNNPASTSPNDASTSDASQIAAGKRDPHSRTELYDWVLMTPAPDQAKVFYWLMCSFTLKDLDYIVDVTDDELATMSHRSVDSIRRARKKAEEYGLIEVLGEQQMWKWTNGKRHQLPVKRKILVNTLPPDGFEGPLHVFEERKRIRAEQAGGGPSKKVPQMCGTNADQRNVDNPSAEPAAPSSSTSEGERQEPENWLVGEGSADVRNPNTQVNVGSADVQLGTADLQSATADPQSGSANLPLSTGVDQGKHGSEKTFQRNPSITLPSPSPSHTDGRSSAAPDSNAGGGDHPQGKTRQRRGRERWDAKGEAEADRQARLEEQRDQAARLLRSIVESVPSELANQLTPDDKNQLIDAVMNVWRVEIPNSRIRQMLGRVEGTGRLAPAWLAKLTALEQEGHRQKDTGNNPARELAACSTCNARKGAGLVERTVLEDPQDPNSRVIPCPACRAARPIAVPDIA